MSEEKDLLEEETVLNNETDINEQSAAAAADDNVDGDAETVEATVENYTEVEEISEEDTVLQIEETIETAEIPQKTEISKPAVAVISALITFVVCAAIVFITYVATYNPYNANEEGYMSTLADAAEMEGMTLDEFKAEYQFPDDMRGDTYTASAVYYMPAGVYFEKMQGISGDMLTTWAQFMGIDPEKVSLDMPYGEFVLLMEEAQAAAEAETEADETETAEEEAVEGETEEAAPETPEEAVAG